MTEEGYRFNRILMEPQCACRDSWHRRNEAPDLLIYGLAAYSEDQKDCADDRKSE